MRIWAACIELCLLESCSKRITGAARLTVRAETYSFLSQCRDRCALCHGIVAAQDAQHAASLFLFLKPPPSVGCLRTVAGTLGTSLHRADGLATASRKKQLS